MKATLTALLLALAVLPALAQTDMPASRVHDYNYFDVNYRYLDMDGASDGGHGLGAAAGVQMNDWLHFFASGSFVTFNTDYADTTMLSLSLGAGAHTALTEDLSTYARAGYMTSETETETEADQFGGSGDFSASSDGFLIGAGLRTSVLPELELVADLSLFSMEGRRPDHFDGWPRLQSDPEPQAQCARLRVRRHPDDRIRHAILFPVMELPVFLPPLLC